MSISAPTVIGTAGTSVTGSTLTTTLSAGASVGDLVIVHFGGSNGRTLNTVTDTGSNAWNLGTGFSQTTVADSDWAWSILTTALNSGDSVNTTLSGNASHAVEVIRCVSTTGWDTSPVDASATAGSAGATSVSVGPTGTTAAADELSLLLVGTGGAVSSWAATSPYTTLGNSASTGTIRHALSAYKVLTATSAETASGTLGTSRAWAGVVTTFRAVSGGGTLYTRTGSDTISGSDSLTRVFVANRSLPDTASASDSLARTILLKKTSGNTASASDSVGRLIVLKNTTADTATASDSVVANRIRIRATSDDAYTPGSPMPDQVDRAIKLVMPISDSAPVSSDSATTAGGNQRSALDNAPASDAATRAAMSKIRSAADTASASDAIAITKIYQRNVYDPLGVGGYPGSSQYPWSNRFPGYTSGYDVATRSYLSKHYQTADSVTGVDVAIRLPYIFQRTTSESLSLDDSATTGNVFARSVFDYGVQVVVPDPTLYPGGLPGPIYIVDVATRRVVDIKSASDTASASDSLSRVIKLKGAGFESLSISDIAYVGTLGPGFTQQGGKIAITIQEPVNGVTVTTLVYASTVKENESPVGSIFVYIDYGVEKPAFADVYDLIEAAYPVTSLFPSGVTYPRHALSGVEYPSDGSLLSDFTYLEDSFVGGAGYAWFKVETTDELVPIDEIVPLAARYGSPYTVIFTGNPVAVVAADTPIYAGVQE